MSFFRWATVVVIVLVAIGYAWSSNDRTKIIGVHVSPDLQQIRIKCDGPIGRHSAFVIQNPYRLVLDLESIGLGKVPGRLNIGNDLINEIRIGQDEARSRVAIDFGQNSVPPFTINKDHDNLTINLEIRGRISHAEARPISKPAVVSSVHSVVSNRPALKESQLVSLKNAGIRDNLIFVELADKRQPNRLFRITFDFIPDSFQIKSASVSDTRGNLKKFGLTLQDPVPDEKENPIKPTLGPTKSPFVEKNEQGTKKFKWGLHAVRDQDTPRDSSASLPFRLEEFKLEKRKDLAISN